MTKRLALILAATVLASAAAAQQPAAGAPPADEQARKQSCAARKFETIVETEVEGAKRGKKVTLCGKEGQTDAEWIATLKDAGRKIEANEAMTAAMKAQITAALDVEIARIEAARRILAAPLASIAPTPPVAPAPEAMPNWRSDYSTLPALPPPLPRAKAAPLAKSGTVATAAALPAAPKPRLTIRCLAPGEGGGGSACARLEAGTALIVRADEDLPAGISLRFLRRGDIRGETALASLRKGQSVRSRLPAGLCAGVASSKVQVQLVSAGQVAETLGPFHLRC